ncbi:MAG: hypothetical protein KatS3mg108_1843 [Isosphaeraceae bacterium]|jgi:hypothetical protein|nr:MAG: hypothetical protein KatS3mg108_1843 [Isosphaeraceae bacterium]
MSPRRLRAPAADGELLADPPLDQAGRLVASNRHRLETWNDPIQGQPASQLRREAQAALLELAGRAADQSAPNAPWILTGHQPELFHPGVWAKNFALGVLARQLQAFPVHLIVDNDLPKAPVIRVPNRDPSGGQLRLIPVPFDSAASEVPYEDWSIRDPALFQSFPDRVLRYLGGLVPRPLIESFWPLVVAETSGPIHPARRFALARASIERQWGLHLTQLPLSSLGATAPFLRFACHLFAHAEPFRSIHNAALQEYRQLNRIRSKNHPVPDLIAEDGWVETPFWVWTRSQPRRRPLLVRSRNGRVELRPAGLPPLAADLPLQPLGNADQAIPILQMLASQGVRIRTRALTTTLFARLFLGDLFLHGIGGAKYDELGDTIITRFFRITPPAYLVVSQTIWLGLPDYADAESNLRHARTLARDLIYNPDRHLPPHHDPEFDVLRERKIQWIKTVGSTHRDRVERWRRLRECNQRLAAAVSQSLTQQYDRIAQLSFEEAWNRVAHTRDLAFVLHDSDRLRAAFARLGQWS